MPPIIDKKKCIKCNKCASICPLDVYGLVKKGETPVVRFPEECWHCRACVMDCPVGAIELRYPIPSLMMSVKASNIMK